MLYLFYFFIKYALLLLLVNRAVASPEPGGGGGGRPTLKQFVHQPTSRIRCSVFENFKSITLSGAASGGMRSSVFRGGHCAMAEK